MKFLAVDDEPKALQDLQDVLRTVLPDCTIIGFSSPLEALAYGRVNPVDVAFLDIEIGSHNGLALAKELKDRQPYIHIVFVTGYEKYAVHAFSVRASGYLLKPVRPDDVQRELSYILSQRPQTVAADKTPGKVVVKTFGGFDVFVDGKPLVFKRAKSKELLAYLIDRRGNSVTTREACDILFEYDLFDENRSGYFRMLVSALRKTLEDAGIEDILIRTRNSLAVNTSRLDCDSYRFLEGDPVAVNSYHRDYMMRYSWAEFSVGLFEGDL